MAKYKKKPVLPIYTIAIVWVIYTLLHPLYQVSDYVSVILISVVVFIVAKGVFPTIEDGPAIPPELVQHAHEQAHEQAVAEQTVAEQTAAPAPAAPIAENKEKEAQTAPAETAPQEPSPEEEKNSRS